MTLFEYGKSVLEAWDNLIKALLYSSPIGRLAKRTVEKIESRGGKGERSRR